MLPHLVLLVSSLGTASANTQYDPTPGSCQIIGDPDVYGLGIRLSYYLQWAAVLFGLWIAPETANSTRAATNIVTLSVFINSLHGANVNDSLMVVEWYIVQYLVFWLLFANLPTTCRALKSSVGSLSVLLINYCIVVTFPVWLYWRGEKQGGKEGCEPSIFLYKPISAYNPHWLLASKVLATMGVTILLLPSFAGACALVALGLTRWRDEGQNDTSDHTMVRILQCVYTLYLVSIGAFAVAFVEMTIKINNVVFPELSLTNSGQLIPLLIGVFTLVSVFWEGLKGLVEYFSKKSRDVSGIKAMGKGVQ